LISTADHGVEGSAPAFICEVKEASFFVDQLIDPGGLAIKKGCYGNLLGDWRKWEWIAS
jgi:hypothetical protein